MINKSSSSQVFDSYASRMISKTARSVEALNTILKPLTTAAREIGPLIIPDSVITAVRGSTSVSNDLKSGVKILSSSSALEISEPLRQLTMAAHVKGGPAETILRVAEGSGYSGFDDALKFLKQYAIDFTDMSNDYKLLFSGPSGAPTEAEVITFVTKHEKTIQFFNEIKKTNSPLKGILTQGNISAGEQQLNAGRSGMTIDDVTKTLTQSSRSERAAAAFGLTGGALAIAMKLGFFVGLPAYVWSNWDSVGKFFTSGEANRYLEPVKDAIGCINSIELRPGSPAIKERELVIQNLENVAALQAMTGPNLVDVQDMRRVYESGAKSAEALIGGDSGSIPNFVTMISEDPNNLIGFSAKMSAYFSRLGVDKYRPGESASALIGAGAGGAMGLRGGVAAGIFGAALGAYAGWNFLGVYYEDQINCLLRAVDGIKLFGDKTASLGKESASTERNSGSSAGSSGQGSYSYGADNLTFLSAVLNGLSTKKIAGLPGIDFIREKELVERFISAAKGSPNAATILLNRNGNINPIINQIREQSPQEFLSISNLSSQVDKSFVKKSLHEKFIQEVLVTIKVFFQKAVHDDKVLKIFNPGEETVISEEREELEREGYVFKESSKNNWNKMNKTSKSINNQEFIRKAAETRVSYFGDANSDLQDQLAKSYYDGLTGMYNEKPQKRSSDYKDLYGFQTGTGAEITLEAHPKSVTLAESMGKGGLVENGLEAKEKSNYIALNTPTGNFQSKYASTIGYLQKLAKAADDQGKKEVSRLIKQTIQNLK